MNTPPEVRQAGNKARGYTRATANQSVRRFNKTESTYTSQLLITVLLLEVEPGLAYKVLKQQSYILVQ